MTVRERRARSGDGLLLVHVNVGGLRRSVRRGALDKFPDTRLGKLLRCRSQEDILTVCDDYDARQKEFYFDRNPSLFPYVLNFYRTGKLHVMDELCVFSFSQEMTYWGIDDVFLDSCCSFAYHERKLGSRRRPSRDDGDVGERDAGQHDDIRRLHTELQHFSEVRCGGARRRLWLTLENPGYSLPSKLFSAASVAAVLASLAAVCVKSLPEYRVRDGWKKSIQKSINKCCGAASGLSADVIAGVGAGRQADGRGRHRRGGGPQHLLVHLGGGAALPAGSKQESVFAPAPQRDRRGVRSSRLRDAGLRMDAGRPIGAGRAGPRPAGFPPDADLPSSEAGSPLHRPALAGGHDQAQLPRGGHPAALPGRGRVRLLRDGLHRRVPAGHGPGHHPGVLVVGDGEHDHGGLRRPGARHRRRQAGGRRLHSGRHPAGGAAHHAHLQQVLALLPPPEGAGGVRPPRRRCWTAATSRLELDVIS
ncbi:uncharacterized protein LOC144023260 isoform X1 [Festucalex cinctus]